MLKFLYKCRFGPALNKPITFSSPKCSPCAVYRIPQYSLRHLLTSESSHISESTTGSTATSTTESTTESPADANRRLIIAKSPAAFYPTIESSSSPSATKLRIPDYISQFSTIDYNSLPQKRSPNLVHVFGRVVAIRRAGKAMYFIDIVQDNARLQICSSNKLIPGLSRDSFAEIHLFVRKGDLVSCVGHPSITNVGELTLKVCQPVEVVSPCLNLDVFPNKIQERALINSNRVMNYLVNPSLKQHILIKGTVTQAIRQFLLTRDFHEVSTPILAGAATGANAEPFVTRLKFAPDHALLLRVAPELWLKKLVIGGFDKVFEIGSNFRNEGIDLSHNPEFSSCEFYQSFTSLAELMTITEDLLRHVHMEVTSKHKSFLSDRLSTLDPLSNQSYPRFEFVPTLEQQTGVPLPSVLTTESLSEYHREVGVPVPHVKSPANLLDNLSGKFLESLCDAHPNTPIFIYNQPAVMSPLAKSATRKYEGRNYEISLRFELFINGREYVNSYEEENSPFAQTEKFRLQQQSKTDFNDDSVIPDWNYVKTMEYGLPPTGGWGCGIDRLSMLFTGASRIEDVLAFGTLRDVLRQ